MKFITVEQIANAEQATFESSLFQIVKAYRQRGFKIDTVLMEGQFKCVESFLQGKHVNLNLCSNDEHIGEIERLICTIKERCRGIFNTITFNKMLGRMVI